LGLGLGLGLGLVELHGAHARRAAEADVVGGRVTHLARVRVRVRVSKGRVYMWTMCSMLGVWY
jgi:hypothetical protein